MSSSALKPVDIKPITGFLDLRSTPDEVPFGGYRWVLNAEVVQKNKLCRSVGWRKLLDGDSYNNADFHDQLGGSSQFLTMLFVQEHRGFSKLFAASQNKIVALNTETRNWKIISDQLGGDAVPGCSEKRFYADAIDDTVVFTNGVDKPVYHIIDQPAIEPSQQSVRIIPDLETLNVTKVGRVVAWSGLMFYFNLEIDGKRQANAVIWSDYRRPLSLLPKAGISLAGQQFFDDGEVVLNAAPMDKNLLFYTTRGIYVVSVTGDAQVLFFTKRYEGSRPGDRCLVYPNTLVSVGSRHFYWGADGVYAYDFYVQEPDRIDWIHRASSRIFDDINTGKCAVHVGGYNQLRKAIWWSWAKDDDECPSETLVINTEFPFSSYVDAGFSAFVNWNPSILKTLRSFILEQCICSSAELIQFEGGFVKEGGFCETPSDPECDIHPASFYSHNGTTVDDVTTEDFSGDPDANSLWTLLGEVTSPEICDAEALAEQCNAGKLFVMAAVKDKCLKEVANVYYREICTFNGPCGTYQKQGYQTVLRSGPLDLGQPNTKKVVEAFTIEAEAVEQTIPSKIKLRIGAAAQALDPNTDGGHCVIMWQEQDALPVMCQSDQTAQEHETDGTYPDFPYMWPSYIFGTFIYFELTIFNDEVSPPDTGGAICMSRHSFYVRLGSD